MRKLLAVILSSTFLMPAFAFDTAKIRMKISGHVADNNQFLCVGHAGCRNLNSIKGKEFSMDTGSVDNIVVLDISSRKMNVQKIPTSCDVKVNKDETLVVSGRLVKSNKGSTINQLNCSII